MELAANEVKRRKSINVEKNSNIYLQVTTTRLSAAECWHNVASVPRRRVYQYQYTTAAMQRLSGFVAHAQSINRQ